MRLECFPCRTAPPQGSPKKISASETATPALASPKKALHLGPEETILKPASSYEGALTFHHEKEENAHSKGEYCQQQELSAVVDRIVLPTSGHYLHLQ